MFCKATSFWSDSGSQKQPQKQASAEQLVISPSTFNFNLFLIGIWASMVKIPLASWSKKVKRRWIIPLKKVLKLFCCFGVCLVIVKLFLFCRREEEGSVLSSCTSWMLVETKEIENNEPYLTPINSNFQVIELNTADSVCFTFCSVQWNCCIWTTTFQVRLWDIFCCVCALPLPELSHAFQYFLSWGSLLLLCRR